MKWMEPSFHSHFDPRKALQACIGVAGACFLTVLLARLLGNSPGILRAVAMAVAAFSMMANPSSGYFPPAGALCALYVEKAVATSVSPQYGYALFPCATGVALLLILCRTITFVAHPVWPFSSKQCEKELMAQPWNAYLRAVNRPKLRLRWTHVHHQASFWLWLFVAYSLLCMFRLFRRTTWDTRKI